MDVACTARWLATCTGVCADGTLRFMSQYGGLILLLQAGWTSFRIWFLCGCSDIVFHKEFACVPAWGVVDAYKYIHVGRSATLTSGSVTTPWVMWYFACRGDGVNFCRELGTTLASHDLQRGGRRGSSSLGHVLSTSRELVLSFC